MSVNALVFADHLLYNSKNDTKYEGAIYYYRTGDTHGQIGDYVGFSLTGFDINYKELPIFEYSDGKKVVLVYKLGRTDVQPDAFQYQLSVKAKIVDKNGNTIVPETQEVTVFEGWAPTQPGYEVVPFTDMFYVPSLVEYQSAITPAGGSTAIGQPAEAVYLLGALYWRKPRPPIGGYIELAGDHIATDLSGSFGGLRFGLMVADDSTYADYFDLVDPDDEWHEGGTNPPVPDPSGPGGGDIPTDDEGEPVNFPDLPSVSVINTGLISLYNPTTAQLQNLAGVLWGNDFEQSIKKVLNDPFDGMIGLSMIPFAPTNGGALTCKIGNFDTQIPMAIVNAQYYTLDCGSITIAENWRNALDYNATSIEIFLPFIGFRTLSIQDCMNKVLTLKYFIDILTGSGIAILKCGNKCLYEWPCNVAYNVPLTGSNKAALYTGLISIALSGAGGLAAGGAMGAVGGAAMSAINVATHSQSDVQRSGAIVSNTGILGEFTPYVVIHRPRQSLAQNFKNYKGYVSNMTMGLSSCSGYTEVEFVHLTGIDGATDTELAEIERLLKGGVII